MSNLLNIKDQSGNWIPIPVVTNGIKSITQNEDYTLTITLNDGTTYTTTSIKGEDGQDYILTEQDKQDIAGLVDTPVDDVRINGQSIVESGVANIPYGSNDNYGLLKASSTNGIFASGGVLSINNASESDIKGGTEELKPLTPNREHMATFYGLAKASGDSTQSQSDNPIGTYTNEAKASIKNMLGVEDVDIDSKAPVITETISGDIASFDDGADGISLKSCIVQVEPVQDLHGYDSPWPAGGGKNKCYCDKTGMVSTTDGYTVTVNPYWGYSDDLIPVSGNKLATRATRTLALTIYGYDADKQFLRVLQPIRSSTTAVSTLGSDVAYIRFGLNINGTEEKFSANLFSKYQIQAEFSDTVTDYAPYENICPITGWTGVKVTRTGKNLLNPAKYEWQTRTFNGITYTVLSDGSVRAVGTSTAAGGPGLTSRFQLPAGTYYGNSSTGSGLRFLYRYAMQETGGATYPMNNPFVSDGTQWFYINLYCNAANLTVDTVLYPQIELGTSFTGFEPYSGDTYDITFPSETGTVYGGTLDVTNGVLTVDRAMVTLDGGTIWVYYKTLGKHTFNAEIGNMDTAKTGASSMYPFYKVQYITEQPDKTFYFFDNRISVRDESYTDAASFGAAVNGMQVVYPLATPITYQLNPQEIKTLLGQNNIWANTGDTEVEYRASTKMYIDRKITEAVAAALNS